MNTEHLVVGLYCHLFNQREDMCDAFQMQIVYLLKINERVMMGDKFFQLYPSEIGGKHKRISHISPDACQQGSLNQWHRRTRNIEVTWRLNFQKVNFNKCWAMITKIHWQKKWLKIRIHKRWNFLRKEILKA